MEITSDQWQEYRSYLLAVAYRLLGSVGEAEDAVQEAYLRLRRHDGADVAEPRAWLTTAVSRICLDQLRSARNRRLTYVGTWLPEPLVGHRPDRTEPDPADRVALSESVQMAVLVLLESLSPAERATFVLHDVFGMGFEQIGDVVGRSAQACRQLASRARAHVRAGTPRFDVTGDERERVAAAFLDAANDGDLRALLRLLDPDVVFRSDGGGVVPAARHGVRGPDRVARLLFGLAELYAGATIRPVPVNAGPGLVMERDGAVIAVAAITVSGSAVTAVDVVLNPDKLRHVQPTADPCVLRRRSADALVPHDRS